MSTFIGVLHLPPLPGSPRGGDLHHALKRAVHDARALQEGGADGLILENLGDAPYTAGRVDAATVALMTRIALAVREAAPELRMGINVLRNDAMSALAIALAVDAQFIRVNVHTGVMVADQGLLQSDARATLLERNRLGAAVEIVADVLVKHAVPLGSPDLADVARDTAYRGLADVLVVTGSGTGRPHDPQNVRIVQQAVPDRPVWVGSGLTPETCPPGFADGGIVGSWLHHNGDLQAPLDVQRVRTMAKALKQH